MEVPDFIKKSVENVNCPHCQVKMKEKYVTGIGIKNSVKYENKTVLFFEYSCNSCKNKVFVELDFMSLEDFVLTMINEYSEDKDEKESETVKTKKTKINVKSKISDDEVAKMMNILDKSKNWDEILHGIGLTDEDIEKYRKEN